MTDVSEINPLKPSWPVRRDEHKQHPESEDDKEKSEQNDSDKTGNSRDGHIDEYA